MESGGSERQMLQLLEHLHRERVKPHLYLTYKFGSLLSQIPQDIPIDYFATKDASRYASIPGLLFALQIKKLRTTIRERQIQVTYDRLYHTVMLGAAAMRGLKVARVVAVVSPPSRDFGQSRQRWMNIKRRILAWSYRSASTLIAVSDETAADASQFYGMPIERWQVIPSPIHLERILVNSQQPAPEAFEKHPGLNIAVLGRLSQEKNHKLLLELLASLTHSNTNADDVDSTKMHLHVIGDGPLRGELEEMAQKSAIQDDVTFYGVQANPHSIVARCDCLCLPSFYEGFPNVVMEAMACRVPVFASNAAGGLISLIGQDKRGQLLDPRKVDLWRQALLHFQQSPQVAESKIDDAYDYVKQHHDLPRWVDQMEDVFLAAKQKIS